MHIPTKVDATSYRAETLMKAAGIHGGDPEPYANTSMSQALHRYTCFYSVNQITKPSACSGGSSHDRTTILGEVAALVAPHAASRLSG